MNAPHSCCTDVFGMDFTEVAQAIGRDASACRQLASRTRTHVQDARPRYPIPKEHAKDIAAAFFAASRKGDMQTLQGLLSADVISYTDGGGKRPSAINPLYGLDRVSHFLVGITCKESYQPGQLLSVCLIDGLPGFITLERDDIVQTTALEMEGGSIKAIYILRNPDKLSHISSLGWVHQTFIYFRSLSLCVDRCDNAPQSYA
jgi:RNA polymerase sigma-70 factor (ECF subfamily)